MNSQSIFANLRDSLADLYPDEASAQRIAADAGLDAVHIDFSGHAMNNWHTILNEAVKVDRVDDLLIVVLAQYNRHKGIRECYDLYRSFIEQGGQIKPLAMGRDKHSARDQVGRDKNTLGDIQNSTIAIGDGAIANNVKNWFLNIPTSWMIAGIGGLGILVLVVVFIATYIPGISNAVSATPTPIPSATLVPTQTPTSLPFEPASESEILIVIARFPSTGVDAKIHDEIRRGIEQAAKDYQFTNLRVGVDSNAILTMEELAQADFTKAIEIDPSLINEFSLQK